MMYIDGLHHIPIVILNNRSAFSHFAVYGKIVILLPKTTVDCCCYAMLAEIFILDLFFSVVKICFGKELQSYGLIPF